MLLTILVPCRDESEALPPLFEVLTATCRELAPQIMTELLFVDDGSVDDTLARLEAFTERCLHPVRVVGLRPRLGLGAAIREGAPLAAGEVVVTYDADRPYPLADLTRLLDPIAANEADVVTASPWHPEGRAASLPVSRSLLSRAVSRLYRLRFGRGARHLHTFTCGYRAYRRQVLLDALPRRDGFTATAEILLTCLRGGARVVEVPSTLRARTEGRSKMRALRVALAHVGLLLRGR